MYNHINKILFCTLIIILFILAFINTCISQSITWQNNYRYIFNSDCVANDICSADNNNFYIVGSNNYPRGIYIIKINSYGDTLWTRFILDGEGVAGVSSGDGGCVVTGMWHTSPSKMYSLKINANGNTIWTKIYDSSETALSYRIIRTSDNKYLACGTISSFYGYITKLDSSGNMIWQKIFSSADTKKYRSLIETNDGCFIAGGYVTDNFFEYGKGLLTKIDTSGNILWEKRYMYDSLPIYDLVINKIDNGYLLSGTFIDNNPAEPVPGYMKLDLDGQIIYSKKILQSQINKNNYLLDTKILNHNKYIFNYYKTWNPYDTTQTYTVITDSSGNILKQNVFSTYDYTYLKKILLLNNGDILFAGESDRYSSSMNNIFAVRTDSNLNYPTVGINNMNNELLTDYNLFQNYPNPFNPETKINYDLPKSGIVKLTIYDVLGREIKTLINEFKQAGTYTVDFNGENLSSGVYYYKMTAGDFTSIKKMVLIK
jgi:hypothetical protein